MENPTHSFTERNLCFSSYEICKLKIKLWWVAALERKMRAFFVRFPLLEGIFLIFVCWIHFENMHTSIYQKALFHTLFCCLFLKSLKVFSVPLGNISIFKMLQFHFLSDVNRAFRYLQIMNCWMSVGKGKTLQE